MKVRKSRAMRKEEHRDPAFRKASSDDVTGRKRRKRGSVLRLIGLGRSRVSDIALKHDKYLYDE